MPELPEVETVRRGLQGTVVGRTVVEVEVGGARTVRRRGADELRRLLTGRRLVGTGRRGKYLALLLDDGAALVVHLGMTGQLLLVSRPDQPRPLHTHVVLALDDGSELRFVDPRTFGEMYVDEETGPQGLPVSFGRLGVDPVADGLSPKNLAAALGGRRLPVKAALLDQKLVAGVGNIYADESLFRARVRPDRRCEALTPADYKRLARAITEVLQEAIEARGSTLSDSQYRDVAGEVGDFQSRHAVYDRESLPCLRCRRPILRTRIAGRSSYFCPRCQR
jgi:formamidopyrimidine-DNA glycosylase